MKSAIENVIEQKIGDFAEDLTSLSGDPFVRDAIMRMVVRDISWALLEKFRDKYGLAEQLGIMAEVIQSYEPADCE